MSINKVMKRLVLAAALVMPAVGANSAPIYSLEIFSGNVLDLGLAKNFAADGSTVTMELVNGQFQATYLPAGGDPVYLGVLPGQPWSQALAVSNNGMVTGYSNYKGFYWEAGVNGGEMVPLGTLGGEFSAGYGVNDHGQVAGESSDANEVYLPIIWELGTGMTVLDLLPGDSFGRAMDINNDGVIVGQSFSNTEFYRAVMWFEGELFDLNDLLDDSGDGWVLRNAQAINEDGWILALATPGGIRDERLVLLKPRELADPEDPELVPAPGMLAIFGVALVGLSWRRRQYR